MILLRGTRQWDWDLRAWLGIVFLDSLHGAWVLHSYPETFTSAYEFAFKLLPIEAWSVLYLLIGLGAAAVLSTGRIYLASAVLGVHALLHMVFAYSIAVLIWGAAPGAWIGAGKWFMFGMISMEAMHRLSRDAHEP